MFLLFLQTKIERVNLRNIMKNKRNQNFITNLEKLFEGIFKQKDLKGFMKSLTVFFLNILGFEKMMLMLYDNKKKQLYTFKDENKNKLLSGNDN